MFRKRQSVLRNTPGQGVSAECAVAYGEVMTDSPPPPADLDPRLVRCFTVLAEHQHFGRAAKASEWKSQIRMGN